MELIDGRLLSEFIRNDKLLPPKSVVLTVRKLALALRSAHEKGIVHRDVKPSNIIIKRDGEPVLMDFGLAQRPVSSGAERLTKEGMLIGSPAYMSPEQVRSDDAVIGHLSDVYGLGVVLYEMLTMIGTPIRRFGGNDPGQGICCRKIRTPPRQLRPDIDCELSGICCKMLAKKPERRFRSMQEVADALHHWLKAAGKAEPQAIITGTTLRAHTGEGVPVGIRRLLIFSVVLFAVTSWCVWNFILFPVKAVLVKVDNVYTGLVIDDRQVTLTDGIGQVPLRPGPHQWTALIDGKAVKSDWFMVMKDQANELDLRLDQPPSKPDAFPIHNNASGEQSNLGNDHKPISPPPSSVTENAAGGAPEKNNLLTVNSPKQAAITIPTPAGTAPGDTVVPRLMTNSIEMKLVLIPAGEFEMGSCNEQPRNLPLCSELKKLTTHPEYPLHRKAHF